MNNWFTVKVKYTKQLENGTFKRVSELYLLSAMTFTDAEARIYEELGSIIRGEFQVMSIQRTDFHDIFSTDRTDNWCVVKISYITSTEESGKDKKITEKFLAGADSIEQATEVITESLSTLMVDYKIESVIMSNIVDVFPYKELSEVEISYNGKHIHKDDETLYAKDLIKNNN
jgi:hypothetical protein